MWIDLHAHNVTMGMLNQHPHWGPTWLPEGLKIGDWILGTKEKWAAPGEDANFTMVQRRTPDKRLAIMDGLGMDKIVLNIPSHTYMYWTEPEFGIPWATTCNNELAEYCSYNTDRLYFWAHAPLQDPAAAVKELDRAVNELGAKGLSCGGSNFGGLEAYSPELYPVWEKCCELDIPVFVHGYNQSVTWGKDAMTDPYDTTSIVGMNSDETKFFWYIVNGGVLDDFPELKIYITHGGGMIPYQLGRYNSTNKTMAPDSKNKKNVIEYMNQFWFDVEVHEVPFRNAILEVIGADHLVYGDNFSGADGIDDDLTKDMDITEEDRAKIKGLNAQKLLGI
jgi:aminocarboxymuconate-semialdehyde decarboxylase